jgi:hypothetical protein
LEQAENDAAGSLRGWLAGFEDHAARPLLEFHAVGYARLCGRVSGSAGDDAEIGELIDLGWLRLNTALAPYQSAVGMGFTLRSTDLPSEESAAMTYEGRSGFEPSDSDELEQVAGGWSEEEWCHWFATGFQSIEQGSPHAYLAFPPLRLYPIGNFISQLGDVLSWHNNRDSLLRERALDAIRQRLATGKPDDNVDDRYYWSLLNELRAPDMNATIARKYHRRLTKARKTISDAVLEIICRTAWTCTATEIARAAFFQALANTERARMEAWEIVALLEEAAADNGENIADALNRVACDIMGRARYETGALDAELDLLAAEGRLVKLGASQGKNIVEVAILRQVISALTACGCAPDPPPTPPTPRSASEILRVLEPA